ncbi:MAG: glycosyltransferase [Planctomycetaceae bacterium]|nr:glycosyltransferase [Planctomycetaceae bacterium]
MAVLFMSMSGEGRGHATRVRSLVEKLRDRHEIHLFAPGDAYQFLAAQYLNDPDVRLVEIPGLKFHYVRGKIHLLKSIVEGFRYKFSQLPPLVKSLKAEIEHYQPDLILTDFEPALPRAADLLKRPYLSLTHQHFLVSYDLSSLPLHLRFFARFTGLAVPLHYSTQKQTIVSSFFHAPFRPSWQDKAVSVGPMIRPEVREGAIRAGLLQPDSQPASNEEPFLLSYLRKQSRVDVISHLEKSSIPIKVYGLGAREPRGKITFHEVHPQRFVDDLLACHAVVSAAGNQLLGECMYLGKPVLALPETWHHEQLTNAHFLRNMKCGDFVTLERFRIQDLENFLPHIEEYRTQIYQTCLGRDGTEDTIQILEEHLQHSAPVKTTGSQVA